MHQYRQQSTPAILISKQAINLRLLSHSVMHNITFSCNLFFLPPILSECIAGVETQLGVERENACTHACQAWLAKAGQISSSFSQVAVGTEVNVSVYTTLATKETTSFLFCILAVLYVRQPVLMTVQS